MEINRKLYDLDSIQCVVFPIPDFGVLTISTIRCVGCGEFTGKGNLLDDLHD